MAARWPNFFIAGAAKCGTTSLYRYLLGHPEIFMSPEKELGFFDHTLDELSDDPEAIERAEQAYLAHFQGAGQAPVIGEGSPGYFWHAQVPERIQARIEAPRFFFSLRDPVERAYSDYLMSFRDGRFTRTFLELVEDDMEAMETGGSPTSVVPQGLYATNLSRFIDTFGHEAVMVRLLDDLKRDPLALLKDIAALLDIDPGPMAELDYGKQHNVYGKPRNPIAGWLRRSDAVAKTARLILPKQLRIYLGDELLLKRDRKPPMDLDAKQLLLDLYEPELDELENLLGRSLPELRTSWQD